MEKRENDRAQRAQQKEHDEYIAWKEWWDYTETWLFDNLDNDLHVQPFGISVVPDELRKWNENAYKPKVVSMGPTYKGARRDLLQMEEAKWFCMLSLTRRLQGHSGKGLLDFSKVVWFGDEYLRRCYTEEISMDRKDLATTMLCDYCFMLELLISGSKELNERLVSPIDKDITAQVRRREEVLTDLMLLENQLPLYVVTDLSRRLFPREFGGGTDDHDATLDIFKDMALSLVGYLQELVSI